MKRGHLVFELEDSDEEVAPTRELWWILELLRHYQHRVQ